MIQGRNYKYEIQGVLRDNISRCFNNKYGWMIKFRKLKSREWKRNSSPRRKKEEAPVEVAKMDEVVLADDDVVKIIVTEKSNDEIFGPMYKFLIENKSDKKLTVQSRDTSIDGVMA